MAIFGSFARLPGIGVVFDIDALGGGFYGGKAWKIFMRHVDARKLTPCILREGDTSATLHGMARRFCIAVYGLEPQVSYIKRVFADLEEAALGPKAQRFVEKPALDSEPLRIRGGVDASGRFFEDSWNRVSHDLCKEAGWGYAPKSVTANLDTQLREELEALKVPLELRTNKGKKPVTPDIPSTKESADKRKKENQINIFEVLMDAICCVMVADRKITTREREAVHKILERTKCPWGHDEIDNRIKAFVQRVKKNGLDSVIQETCEKIPEFKKIGKEEVFLRCIDYMMRADRHIDEREIQLCQKFRSILGIEKENKIKEKTDEKRCHTCGRPMEVAGKLMVGGWSCPKCNVIFCGDCCDEPEEKTASEYIPGRGNVQIHYIPDGLQRRCRNCSTPLNIWKANTLGTERNETYKYGMFCDHCDQVAFVSEEISAIKDGVPVICPHCGKPFCA